MSRCVSSWHLNPKLTLPSHSNSLSLVPDIPVLDYEVAELTWENGQFSMHGLGLPRVPTTSQATPSHTKYKWDKPRATGGTLESIVDQATFFAHQKTTAYSGYAGGDASATPISAVAATATTTIDALVPCTNNRNKGVSMHMVESGVGTCSWVECSTLVVSADAAHDWSSGRDQSMTRSATFGRDNRKLTLDMCKREFGVGGITTSMGSPENTSSCKQSTGENHVYFCHKGHQREATLQEAKKKAKGKSSISSKRVRAAAVHNQSERKRRDKINQRMKMLQKLIPNSSKTDKASMLDEVIEYLKQLQAQVNLSNRMNMSPMMLPLTMQQQLQTSMMVPMMGPSMMGMGLNIMDMNTMGAGRPNLTGMPPVLHPTAVISPFTSWEGTGGDRLHTTASVIPDPMSTFLTACQSQSMNVDAYSMIATPLYQ